MIRLLGTSLYPDKDRVVQELLANATDAIRLKESSNPNFVRSSGRITIEICSNPPLLVISDNGVGITAEQLELAFFNVGTSGKRELIEAAKSDGATVKNLVGGFGIGVLSTLLISDECEIISRPQNQNNGFLVRLSSKSYRTVSEAGNDLTEGTSIKLRLNVEGAYLSERSNIEKVLNKYCRLVPFPIYFKGEENPYWPGRKEKILTSHEAGFIDEIETLLRMEGFDYQREPSIGGLRPDFVVYNKDGSSVVVEAKKWSREPGYILRALKQIEQYKRVTGAGSAIVILPGSSNENSPEGVSSLQDLVEAIRHEFRKPRAIKQTKPVPSKGSTIICSNAFL